MVRPAGERSASRILYSPMEWVVFAVIDTVSQIEPYSFESTRDKFPSELESSKTRRDRKSRKSRKEKKEGIRCDIHDLANKPQHAR